MKFEHWHIEQDADDIIWLGLDVAGKSVNVLTVAVLHELADISQQLADTPPAGLVLHSLKSRGFIFGADINEFEAFTSEDEIKAHIGVTLNAIQRIEDLPCPTVALVDGVALGGGCELVLGFDVIVGLDDPSVQIGFPEVNLGLLPGYGGTGRMFKRAGLTTALNMVLHGKPLKAKAALSSNIFYSLVNNNNELKTEAKNIIKDFVNHDKASAPAENVTELIVSETAKVAARFREVNTPAPFEILRHFDMKNPDQAQLIAAETGIFSRLMMGDASRGLRRVFALNDAVKKQGRGNSDVTHIHVIGAGVMGGDIAAVAAMSGFKVTLQDISTEVIANALKRAHGLYDRRLKPADAASAKDRLQADQTGAGLLEADLMIEAVAENLDIKRMVFAEAESKMKADAIMATNTSAIPLEDIGALLKDPSRLIGMHFFNPVPVLPLVEIVHTEVSDAEVIRRAMCVSGAMKKLPIACKSSPGFLVNRALLPYLFAAIDAVIDGENADLIDQALVEFGMPMGPIELADQIGLDVCHDAGIVLGMSEKSEARLKELIAAGTIGRKSGQGFYEWDDKKAIRLRASYDAEALHAMTLRLLTPLVAECRAAVAEGVVESGDMADAAMLFGTGFAAHTGGPLFWADKNLWADKNPAMAKV